MWFQNHIMVLKTSAQKLHTPLLLTGNWPKQITGPSLYQQGRDEQFFHRGPDRMFINNTVCHRALKVPYAQDHNLLNKLSALLPLMLMTTTCDAGKVAVVCCKTFWQNQLISVHCFCYFWSSPPANQTGARPRSKPLLNGSAAHQLHASYFLPWSLLVLHTLCSCLG